jgi:diketogulonate reductase-like aldo/keto reductase
MLAGKGACMRTVEIARDEVWPALGLGTWRMGERAAARASEVAAVRQAFELGYRLIDSAEMYGEGGAETVVGEALAEALRSGSVAREAVRIVSKVYPHNAEPQAMRLACERSRKRLKLDCIDLYLLHWRGSVALQKTIEGFEALQRSGWIRHWGVSNLDVDAMRELVALRGGQACAANQVYYSLSQRGVEFDLLPWQRGRAMPLMAYCPIDGGALACNARLIELAAKTPYTAAQVALAWVLGQTGVIAIPKTTEPQRLRENLAAASLKLDTDLMAALDSIFPPPRRKHALVTS